MHLKVLEGIRAKYPQAEVEIIINDEFQRHVPFFELDYQISKVHLFPRQKLQNLITNPESHLLEPYWLLNDFLETIQQSNYDQIYNFTHTRLSGYLMGLITGKSKFGLVIENQQTQLLGSKWLAYLNEHFASGFQADFHLIEVLCKAFELPVFKEEAESRVGSTILLQPLTSDAKKNWPLARWKELKDKLLKEDPSLNIFILASSSDVSLLTSVFDLSDLLIVSFSEAQQWLKTCLLLISADTSLIHLAALNRAPTLMISLGSSDPIKTGPFLQGAQVLSGQAECRPCHHDRVCKQSSHFCGDSLVTT